MLHIGTARNTAQLTRGGVDGQRVDYASLLPFFDLRSDLASDMVAVQEARTKDKRAASVRRPSYRPLVFTRYLPGMESHFLRKNAHYM